VIKLLENNCQSCSKDEKCLCMLNEEDFKNNYRLKNHTMQWNYLCRKIYISYVEDEVLQQVTDYMNIRLVEYKLKLVTTLIPKETISKDDIIINLYFSVGHGCEIQFRNTSTLIYRQTSILSKETMSVLVLVHTINFPDQMYKSTLNDIVKVCNACHFKELIHIFCAIEKYGSLKCSLETNENTKYNKDALESLRAIINIK